MARRIAFGTLDRAEVLLLLGLSAVKALEAAASAVKDPTRVDLGLVSGGGFGMRIRTGRRSTVELIYGTVAPEGSSGPSGTGKDLLEILRDAGFEAEYVTRPGGKCPPLRPVVVPDDPDA